VLLSRFLARSVRVIPEALTVTTPPVAAHRHRGPPVNAGRPEERLKRLPLQTVRALPQPVTEIRGKPRVTPGVSTIIVVQRRKHHARPHPLCGGVPYGCPFQPGCSPDLRAAFAGSPTATRIFRIAAARMFTTRVRDNPIASAVSRSVCPLR